MSAEELFPCKQMPTTKEYKDGWDGIFSKKKKKEIVKEEKK